jgi:peptidoglycan hydrolase-like protein with peptidoglycan-binding domain
MFSTGSDVAELQELLRRIGRPVPAQEAHAQTFGTGTKDALATFQKAQGLAATGVLDDATAAALARAVAGVIVVPPGVSGVLYLGDGRVAAGVKVRAVHRGFAGVVTKLGECVSAASGHYSITYAGAPDLRTGATASGAAVDHARRRSGTGQRRAG